jgi:hypothetical protein
MPASWSNSDVPVSAASQADDAGIIGLPDVTVSGQVSPPLQR